MLNQMQKTVCALAVLTAASMPAWAESVNLSVTGTIDPAACTPTLGSNGTVDYGRINASQLSAESYTQLGAKELELTINCSAPAKVAIRAVNGRVGSLAAPSERSAGGTPAPFILNNAIPTVVGLGLDGTTKIGGYAVNLGSATVEATNGNSGNVLTLIALYSSNGSDWNGVDTTSTSLYRTNTDNYISWGSDERTPAAFTTMTTTLQINAYINKSTALDLSKPVNLDGLTTIELVYL
jgi:type 1 fimbria pilin